ncbi:hypothetical protein NQ176_g5376 [Zarea fungicola]|uniref:Uncharacterized protein n=1 Tax=Zarea fungicola TaxID=93591 RepID=A0ACC1N8W0_9HYPO|nr:hypothetical protein NQ176_g5376 [Lecanicillium fungicola]
MQLSSSVLALIALGISHAAASPAVAPLDDDTFYKMTLPEFTPDGLKVVDLRFENTLDKRATCGSVPGVANGECVRYYSDSGCADRDHIKGYKPTCGGNCYVDKFHSVKAIGDGTYSTNCELFSDTACQSPIATVGSKTGGGQCANANGWSMKCYYRC